MVLKLKSVKNPIEEDKIYLPPRQEEMFNIIKDHKIVNFNQIKRRFLEIPDRTLRYDLLALNKRGLIRKIGNTRGVYYHIND